MTQPGLLFVAMQPRPSLSATAFHDWYQNEHGPTRLRLPFITTGLRYQLSEQQPSTWSSSTKFGWLAIYDIEDMAELNKPDYLRLRAPPVKTQREMETMPQIDVNRRLYDVMESHESSAFPKPNNSPNGGGSKVLVAVTLLLQSVDTSLNEIGNFLRTEHVKLLSMTPGWLRFRWYITSSIDPNAPMECLLLYDFGEIVALDGPDFQRAMTMRWTEELKSPIVKSYSRQAYDLYYTFGPAPRFLGPKLADWESSDPATPPTTIFSQGFGGNGAIESYITTSDGAVLQYRLEGSSEVNAPLILLSNSILVDWTIWDGFLASFAAKSRPVKYRFLRYLTRGRTAECGTHPISIDVLSSDMIALMNALMVPRVAAIIGVSLGGATTLNTALTYSNRVDCFISCDTNLSSPASNAAAWNERVAVAEEETAVTSTGQPIVGSELAEMTVRRWFTKKSFEEKYSNARISDVRNMIKTNSLTGFKQSVQALNDYDMTEKLANNNTRGLFLVGELDGTLPASMKELAVTYGNGAQCAVIEGAGHLPMVEKPEGFAKVVRGFLTA